MLKQLILGILFFINHSVLYAQSEQSLIVLKERLEQHVLNQLTHQYEGTIKVTADRIDSRLHLKPCNDEQLEIFNPYQAVFGASMTMGIKCQELDNHWTVYVPTHISIERPVVVAKNNLLKDALITENDVQLNTMDVMQLKQGYFTDLQQVIGQVSKQNINQGGCLLPGVLTKAMLVHKGERISIQMVSDDIRISMIGIAMSDGAFQDVIQVKNLSSHRIVEGQISGRSEVRVII